LIILDTNVVSEPLRSNPDGAVQRWLDRQRAETLFLTATNLAELLSGIRILPAGRRKDSLSTSLEKLLDALFNTRVLPFDKLAAIEYAVCIGRTRSAGHTIGVADAQIAAIAATRGFIVATRDTTPFVAAGLKTVNPWDEGK
jgi:predicted nucleic acid-binding protein